MEPLNPYRREVAAEVRAEMARQQVTASTLAEGANIATATLSRRLNGVQPFDVDELAAIAACLGQPVAKFLPTHLAATA